MPKYGEIRESDGRMFRGFQRRWGKVYEHWCNPESFAKRHKRKNEAAVKWKIENREKFNESARKRGERRRIEQPERVMWIRARHRAGKKGIPFNLEPADVVIPARCPVLGIKLAKGKGLCTDNSPEIDRIVAKKGYVKGNIVVVSRRANRVKSNLSIKDLVRIAGFYKQFL